MAALLRVHQAGRRLRLTLDDPRRQNALSAEMVAAIGQALDDAPTASPRWSSKAAAGSSARAPT